MIIPNEVRKCVVFLGYKMADGSMRMAGSAFFLGMEAEAGQAKQVFLVTAKHVVDGVRRLGIEDIYVRANLKDGNATWVRCNGQWLFHPESHSVDVALLKTDIPAELDHLAIPHSLCATDEIFAAHEVGLGDEVFVVGLFRHHSGDRRNVPIVRVGNLAAMSEEKVVTQHFGPMDAYLIEARSIGGLSGSAVFLNFGVIRFVNGQVKHAQSGPIFFLLGLIHGHYDVPSSSIDSVEIDGTGLTTERINTGMAIVVPMHKIFQAIEAHAYQQRL
jgi:hypothetical protein